MHFYPFTGQAQPIPLNMLTKLGVPASNVVDSTITSDISSWVLSDFFAAVTAFICDFSACYII